MVNAFLVGATGEVGKCLFADLVASPRYDKVVVLVRKPLGYDGPRKEILEEHVCPNFDDITEDDLSIFGGCDVAFCTLGSTRAKAGSAEAFEKIDYGYSMKIAKIAKAAGCKYFGLVTAVGSDPNSSFLYPRVKGKLEEGVKGLGFPVLSIFRPGFLICDRQESRILESIGLFLIKGVNAILPDRYAISTERVAKAMLNDANQQLDATSPASFNLYENLNIAKLSN